MIKASDVEPAARICRQKGGNKGLPPVWLVYFGVHDLAASLESYKKLDGVVHIELKEEIKTGSFDLDRDRLARIIQLLNNERRSF